MPEFNKTDIPDLIDQLDLFANYLVKTIYESSDSAEQDRLRSISYETSALLLSLESLQD
ncbi:hypothetical protein GCM10028805_52190 [Spirosoma harenae]